MRLVKQLDEFYAKPEGQTEDVVVICGGNFLNIMIEFGREVYGA